MARQIKIKVFMIFLGVFRSTEDHVSVQRAEVSCSHPVFNRLFILFIHERQLDGKYNYPPSNSLVKCEEESFRK